MLVTILLTVKMAITILKLVEIVRLLTQKKVNSIDTYAGG